MLARALLLGLLALASISSQAWATGPAYYPPGGSGSGVVANTCSAGDFFSAVDAGGNFTCSTPSGSGDVTAVGDCASGACFDGTTGTTLTFKNATSGTIAVTPVAGALGTRTISLPAETGTVCTTGSICSGAVTYQAGPLSGDVVTSGAAATIQANSVALTTDTTGNYAAGDAEAGNATGVACTDCVALTTETTGNYVATITGGAGIASTGAATGEGIGHTLSTASDEADFLKSGALTCGASTQGKMQVHTTPLQYCDNSATPALQYAAYGNSSGESTAAANDSVALTTDTTGNYAAGDAEAGNATGLACTTCVDATDIATGAVTTGKILDATIAQVDIDDTQTLAGNPANGDSSVWFATTGLIWEGATSNSNEGLLVAADVGGDRTWTLPDASGTIAVSASTPLTLNATTGNLTIADAAADSSTKGAVTFPSTHFTCTSGTCSLLASPTFGAASGTSYTWTWDLSSGTDPSLIFSTGAVALGSSTGLYGSTSSSGDLNLFSTTHATKGQITLDDQVDIWPSIPDATAASRAIDFSSDYAVSGVAVIHSLMNSRPTVHVGAASGLLGGFAVVSSSGMVIAHDNATATPSGVLLFYADHTIRTTVAAAAPESVSFYDHTTVQGSGSITVPSSSGHRSFYASPIISAVDSATATYSAVTMYDALPRVGTDNGASTDGTAVTVTTLKGFNYADVSIDGGTGTETVATQVGVDIGALANGGTNIGLRNASTSVFTPTTQAIAAATDTITCNTTFKKFTTFTGTNALTSNPSIADGQTGQICILENVDATGTDCITLTDSTKGMQLSGNFTLCPNDTIILIYDGTDWIELSEMDN